jgi:hypothetical protein
LLESGERTIAISSSNAARCVSKTDLSGASPGADVEAALGRDVDILDEREVCCSLYVVRCYFSGLWLEWWGREMLGASRIDAD